MKEYLKPEVEFVDFVTEVVAANITSSENKDDLIPEGDD